MMKLIKIKNNYLILFDEQKNCRITELFNILYSYKILLLIINYSEVLKEICSGYINDSWRKFLNRNSSREDS